MLRTSILIVLLFIVAVIAMQSDPAETIPAFARKYRFSCTTCHVAAPMLKDYGDEFAGNGFQLPDDDEPPRAFIDVGDDNLLLQRDMPLAIRFDAFARFRSEHEVDSDAQFPYGVKLLSGGNIAPDIGYYFYFYMDERGEVAGLEDAYVHFNNIKGTELDLMVGQFQISDPLFKREVRLTFEDYQIYKTKIGLTNTNLTYDRGIIASYSLPTKTDIILEVINGNGLHDAGADRMFDEDSFKNVFVKVAQEIPFGTFGVFGFTGKETNNDSEKVFDPADPAAADIAGEKNEFLMFGPDISIGTDMITLNAQYLLRRDSNPYFVADVDDDQETDGVIVEAILNPDPQKSKLLGVLLYNKVSSDVQGVPGEPGFDYETVTGSLSWMLRTNLRLLGEVTYDTEREETTFTIGYVSGF